MHEKLLFQLRNEKEQYVAGAYCNFTEIKAAYLLTRKLSWDLSLIRT